MNSNKINHISMAVCVASSLLLGGCARNISNDVYSDQAVGESARTLRGRIVSLRQVTVAPETLEENGIGMIAGGALGGIGGSLLGKGKGKLVATGLGAVGGAAAGAALQQHLKTQNAIEYTVELSDHQLRTIVQGPQPFYPVGSYVFIMENIKGRARIVADNSFSAR